MSINIKLDRLSPSPTSPTNSPDVSCQSKDGSYIDHAVVKSGGSRLLDKNADFSFVKEISNNQNNPDLAELSESEHPIAPPCGKTLNYPSGSDTPHADEKLPSNDINRAESKQAGSLPQVCVDTKSGTSKGDSLKTDFHQNKYIDPSIAATMASLQNIVNDVAMQELTDVPTQVMLFPLEGVGYIDNEVNQSQVASDINSQTIPIDYSISKPESSLQSSRTTSSADTPVPVSTDKRTNVLNPATSVHNDSLSIDTITLKIKPDPDADNQTNITTTSRKEDVETPGPEPSTSAAYQSDSAFTACVKVETNGVDEYLPRSARRKRRVEYFPQNTRLFKTPKKTTGQPKAPGLVKRCTTKGGKGKKKSKKPMTEETKKYLKVVREIRDRYVYKDKSETLPPFSFTEQTNDHESTYDDQIVNGGVPSLSDLKKRSDEELLVTLDRIRTSGRKSAANDHAYRMKRRKKQVPGHKDSDESDSDESGSGDSEFMEGEEQEACEQCDLFHGRVERCPLSNVSCAIQNEKTKVLEGFGVMKTLPSCLYFGKVKDSEVGRIGVFTSEELSFGTQFGPMEGEMVRYADIKSSTNMQHVWVVEEGFSADACCLSLEDVTKANWLRYIRLDHSKTGSAYNLLTMVSDNKVYVVTSERIPAGSELRLKAEESHLNSCGLAAKYYNNTECELCGIDYKRPFFLQRHIYLYHQLHKGIKMICYRYDCPICGKIIFGRKNMFRHSKEEHDNVAAHRCTCCRRLFSSKEELSQHQDGHCTIRSRKNYPFKCDQCRDTFGKRETLMDHMSKMHHPDGYTCEICNKKYKNQRMYRVHQLNIHAENKFDRMKYCDKCGKGFTDSFNLKVHLLSHSGVKPFQCQEEGCSVAYTTKQCLQKHYISAHNYTRDTMPPIARAIPFTTEACSGEGIPKEK